jgi:TnpA family transposase
MPRRTLLSSEQRARLFSIPIDAAEMARHFVLSVEDLALIRSKRRAANRLGFAVQLCALRHPGRVLDPTELPPEPMLAFVGKQVGIDPTLFSEYARRAETRREHITELQKLLRPPRCSAWVVTIAPWLGSRSDPPRDVSLFG